MASFTAALTQELPLSEPLVLDDEESTSMPMTLYPSANNYISATTLVDEYRARHPALHIHSPVEMRMCYRLVTSKDPSTANTSPVFPL